MEPMILNFEFCREKVLSCKSGFAGDQTQFTKEEGKQDQQDRNAKLHDGNGEGTEDWDAKNG